MTTEKFEEIFNSRIEKIKDLLIVKAKEYATNDDRLHNFRKAANRLGTSMEAICWQHFCEKHLVSLDDIINDTKLGKFPSKEKLEEKLMDILIYGFLLEAAFVEDIEVDELNYRSHVGWERLLESYPNNDKLKNFKPDHPTCTVSDFYPNYRAVVGPYIKESESNISKVYDKDIVEMLKHYKPPLPFIKEILPEGWENSIDIGKLSPEKRKEIYEQYKQEFYPEELKESTIHFYDATKVKSSAKGKIVVTACTVGALGKDFNTFRIYVNRDSLISMNDKIDFNGKLARVLAVDKSDKDVLLICNLITNDANDSILSENIFTNSFNYY
jgi:hypothetical protein